MLGSMACLVGTNMQTDKPSLGKEAEGFDVDKNKIVPQPKIFEWMLSDSSVAQYHAFFILWESSRPIDPPLPAATRNDLVLGYLRSAVVQNKEDDYHLSDYEAGEHLKNWILWLAKVEPLSSPLLQKAKDTLAELLLSGNQRAQEAILLATLEHIFIEENVRRLFSDWSQHSVLNRFYKEGSSLADSFKKRRFH
jgi:hypothetical protein